MLNVKIDSALRDGAAKALATDVALPDAVRLLLQRVIEERAAAEPAELDAVRLRADVSLKEGLLHLGETGTVVHRYPSGEAFEVEFTTPVAAVLTLRASEIELLDQA